MLLGAIIDAVLIIGCVVYFFIDEHIRKKERDEIIKHSLYEYGDNLLK